MGFHRPHSSRCIALMVSAYAAILPIDGMAAERTNSTQFKTIFERNERDASDRRRSMEFNQAPVDTCMINPDLPQCRVLSQTPIDPCTVNPELERCRIFR